MGKTRGENRNASDVAAITLGGRFLMFIGRTMYLGRFGANPLLNTFAFAIQVPTVLSTLAQTALSTVMIPVYNSLLAKENHAEAKKFIDNVISISLVLLGLLAIAGIAAAPVISSVVGSGENAAYLTFTLRILMPVMLFFGFGAVFQGILQSHGSFLLPALVSAPGGIVLIGYIIFLGDTFGVTGLIFATLFGAALQPLILIPAIRRLGYRYRFSIDFTDKNVRAAGRLCVPVLVSVGAYQVHFIFGHLMAYRLGVADFLDYTQQLVQVFILVMVASVIAVYFPKLSALWAKADISEYCKYLRNAVTYTFFLVLPAACGLFVLRFEIVDFLLSWRESEYLTEENIRMAGNLMGFYAIGIIAISLKEVSDRAFYSAKDSKTPAIFGVIIMLVNISAIVILLPHFGAYAIPAAYAVAAFIGCGGLLVKLYFKTKFVNHALVLDFIKIIAASGIMVGAALVGRSLNFTDIRIVKLIVPAVFGAAAYFAAAFLFKISVLRRTKR
ncbi:MAG: polysaccharide biosynthesis C-terminal domain-containing protein [Defluviitaleaceae bacterium]|nr:polysaccharide biosynthesis C-terminal domain-containing protein [Defluviitaleaceae bacterium]